MLLLFENNPISTTRWTINAWVLLNVAWFADGEVLLWEQPDGIIQVYAMDIDLLMSLARSRVTRNLTPEECRKYLHRDDVPPIP